MPRAEIKAGREVPWATIALLALAAAVRVWALATSGNGIDFHFNAYDRPLYVWHEWAPSGDFLPPPTYPPAHYFLLRIVFVIFGFDPEWLPRVLSLVLGVASIWALLAIADRLFGRRVMWWTGIAAALYPLGVRLAVVGLETTLFQFAALMAVWMWIAAGRKDLAPALGSALFLTLAMATRFEGWLLAPLMAALWWRDGRARGLAFGVIAAIFPLAWIAYNHAATGDALAFMHTAAAVHHVHAESYGGWQTILGWPLALWHTSTWPAVVLMAVGLAAAWRKREGWRPAAPALFLLAVFGFFTWRGTMALNETKYIALVGLLLLPYAGLGVETIAQVMPRRAYTAGVALPLAIVAVVSIGRLAEDAQRFAPSPDVQAVCGFLAAWPGDEPVVLGVGYQGYILAKSGLPYARFALVPSDDRTGRIAPGDFWDVVTRRAPCLLIHDIQPDRLDFQDILPAPTKSKDAFSLHGFTFTPVFRAGEWSVLAVSPSE